MGSGKPRKMMAMVFPVSLILQRLLRLGCLAPLLAADRLVLVAMSIRDNNQQLDMRVLTRSGALHCRIQTASEYPDPCQRSQKPELGPSDLKHGNETAVPTDSVR